MDNNLNITIRISFSTLKLLQDGAYIMSSNFNRTHPKHGFVQSDRNYSWERFMEMAISEKYQREVELQNTLDNSSCS